ncbi:isochorismatase family protein [Actinophytocola sp.]|uniref:isochorismatase family protein n=1 Tax=Actinophytocola sp. TaxID=1872138 RepID=UPI00389AD6B5
MSIPTITPYELPAAADLPYGRAGWRLDPSRAVLLIHDMQQYFVDFFPAGQEPMASVIRNIAAIRAAAVARGVPVVYTAQPGSMTAEQRGLLRAFWGEGMDATPAHRRMVEPLEPALTDLVLTKWRYSAFARTDLDTVIREYGRDQLIVCGIYAHVGCLMTACDAFTRDIQPFLVVDAIADFSLREHLMAVDYAERRCAVTPGTATVVADLTAHDRIPGAR